MERMESNRDGDELCCAEPGVKMTFVLSNSLEYWICSGDIFVESVPSEANVHSVENRVEIKSNKYFLIIRWFWKY